MPRYRLRFLLQEIDLRVGETLIGRSGDCQVTIEDPLVSREHAKIVIDGQTITVFDLKSRNGVKVNGHPVRGNAQIFDGDRIRVGTQELVFCLVDNVEKSMKTTGFLRHCADCHLPYPQEIKSCPNCGSTALVEDETLSGDFNGQDQGSWSLQLLIEVLDKALGLGRLDDVDRVMRRAIAQCDDHIQRDGRIDERTLNLLTAAAMRATLATQSATFALWAVRVHERLSQVPPEDVQTYFMDAARHHVEVASALEQLSLHLMRLDRPFSERETRALTHFERLRTTIGSRVAAPRILS